MKSTKFIGYGYLLVLSVALLIAGCVSDPVKTELTVDHPANFRAPETPFIRPPNPFKDDRSLADLEADDSVDGSHEGPDEKDGQTKNHQMDPMKKPKSTHGSAAEEALPEHKEHHQ